MKRSIGIIGVVIAVGLILVGIGFGIRMWRVNTDRIIFKQSAVYTEGVADDLAKYKFEMQTTQDEAEKKVICEFVNSRFANLDESKLENDDLKRFLKDCRNGELN
ncbi:MAG: hypothetical protein HY818_05290 [Acetobacterium woodii]|nr:hypothetical protein [Acetobacterium woodii]